MCKKGSMEALLLANTQRDAWNAFVAASPAGHVLQSWEWGELKERTGWQPLRLALRDGGDIKAGAQVLLRTLPYGFGKMAYVPKGPALDYADEVLVRTMFAALEDLATRRRVISLKVEPEVVEPSPV